MKLLAVDTSSNRTTVALWHDGEVWAMTADGTGPSASRLFVLIDALLEATACELAELDCFAIGAGPGSFTGLRVSYSALRTLAWAGSVPIVQVNSLHALAWPWRELDGTIAVVQPARRGHVYYLPVRHGQPVADVEFLPVAEAHERIAALGEPFFLAGMLPEEWNFSGRVLDRAGAPQAADIARIAAEEFIAGRAVPPEEALPLYLRPSDAEVVAETRLHAEKT